MTPRQREKQDLLARIDVLLDEAAALPRSTGSWERRQQIDWELVQIFRRIGNLSAGPRPYWIDPAYDDPEARDADATDARRSP